MLEQGVSVRCMVTWMVWTAAAATGVGAALIRNEGVARLAMVLACFGMMMVILNDNARTRRVLRVGIREAGEARERATLSGVPRT